MGAGAAADDVDDRRARPRCRSPATRRPTITPTVVMAAMASSTRSRAAQRAPRGGVDQPDGRRRRSRRRARPWAGRRSARSGTAGRARRAPRRAGRTTWLRAPIASLTAVREPLAPTGRPCVNAGGGVRGAHRDELLPDADVLVVAARERARGEDLVGEAHEEQADRGGDEGERRRRVQWLGKLEAGQARRDLADDRRRRGEPAPRSDDRRDRPRAARPGSAARGSGAASRIASAAHGDGERRPLHVAELADDLRELRAAGRARRCDSPSSLPSWPITSTTATPWM